MDCVKTWTEKRKDEKGTRRYGIYICRCGMQFRAMTDNVAKGNTTKCKQCANKSRSTEKTSHGDSQKSKSEGGKLYYTWRAMIRRCENTEDSSYKNYGGRGISVCQKWRESYEAFRQDMGYPKASESIDRIDVNGDYCPENCKWATLEEQANNKRSNRYVEHNGEVKTLTQWCDLLGLDYNRTKARLTVHRMPPERAFKPGKLVRRGHYMVEGKEYTALKDAALSHGMSVSAIHGRIKSPNWPNWYKL